MVIVEHLFEQMKDHPPLSCVESSFFVDPDFQFVDSFLSDLPAAAL